MGAVLNKTWNQVNDMPDSMNDQDVQVMFANGTTDYMFRCETSSLSAVEREGIEGKYHWRDMDSREFYPSADVPLYWRLLRYYVADSGCGCYQVIDSYSNTEVCVVNEFDDERSPCVVRAKLIVDALNDFSYIQGDM